MTEVFIGKRITELRLQRDLSECQLSLELGLSKSYVQSISSGRSLPSARQLFNIANYFGVSLSEFFDEGNHDSIVVRESIRLLRELDEEESAAILSVLKQLTRES